MRPTVCFCFFTIWLEFGSSWARDNWIWVWKWPWAMGSGHEPWEPLWFLGKVPVWNEAQATEMPRAVWTLSFDNQLLLSQFPQNILFYVSNTVPEPSILQLLPAVFCNCSGKRDVLGLAGQCCSLQSPCAVQLEHSCGIHTQWSKFRVVSWVF